MANLTVSVSGFSISDFFDAQTSATAITRGTGALIFSYSGASMSQLVLVGSKLKYDTSGNLIAGNITSIRYYGFEGSLLWTMSGLTLAGASTQAAITALGGGDATPWWSLLQALSWTATGASGSDDLWGGAQADLLTGGWGNDRFVGFAGDDTFIGGPLTGATFNSDQIGDDYDTVDYSSETGGRRIVVDMRKTSGQVTDTYANVDTLSGIEAIIGTAAADVFRGSDTARYEAFTGGAGNDIINGGSGLDDDVRYDREGGTKGVTVNLATGKATDTYGNTDTLSGIERVGGTRFADTITGNALDNIFIGFAGADTLIGGAGNDTARYDRDADTANASGVYGTKGIRVNLQTSVDAAGNRVGVARDGYGNIDTLNSIENIRATDANDRVVGGSNANVIWGLGGNDGLFGGGGDDTLYGGGGQDDLYGGAGNDTLNGGWGADLLAGGAGNDLLTGDLGYDTFMFDTALGATNVDRITDFAPSEDVIQLASSIFTALKAGPLSASAFVVGTTATQATAQILYNSTTGALSYDADGTGAGAAVQFATLDAVGGARPTLSAAAFSVV